MKTIAKLAKPTKYLLLWTLLLSLLPVSALALGSRYPDKDHLEVDYADMDASGYDETALRGMLAELEELCAAPEDQEDRQTRKRAQTLYDEILRELNVLGTQSTLIEIAYDTLGGGGDAAAEQAAKAAADIQAQSEALYDAVYAALSLLAATPYGDIIDADAGKGAAEALLEYEAQTEEEAALSQEETRLVQEYDQVMARTDLTEEEQAAKAAELYCQLVQVRAQIAQLAGYDDYAAYAYENIYSRDYTVEEAQDLAEAVKKSIVPLGEPLWAGINTSDLRALSLRSRATGEEILDAIQPFIRDLDPELGRTFAFMRKHHLYDIEASASKLPTGYTVGLPAYGTAFIFNSPYGDYQDYSDTVHEFGHFNETFHATTHDLWANFSIDVGEIHSQTLELLFASRAYDVFGSYGETYAAVILSNILDSVLAGCMYDEFQTAVYQNPDMSPEEINRLFKTVSEQYGYYYEEGVEESTYWVEIPHNFSSPLYYISYATSALSALDLWLRAQEDWNGAVDTYMDLTVLSLDVPYRAAMEEMELTDIFEDGAVEALARRLERRIESGTLTDRSAYWRNVVIGLAILLAVFLLFIGLITWVVWRLGRKRRKQRALQEKIRNAGLAGGWPPQGPGPL